MKGTTISLKHSIEVEGEKVNKLTLRRPKLKHLKGVDLQHMDGETIILLVSRLADIPPSSVEEIDGADLDAIGEVIGNFFGQSPATGGKA